MSAPVRNTAVVRTEPAGVPYVLRTRAAEILNTDDARAQIAPFIPPGTDWQLVLAEVHRASTNNPEILECTAPSVIQAVGQAVQTGLVIGRTIHLVPVNTKVSKRGEQDRYEKRLQAWTDYKGDIELVIWSGAARHIDAKAVYQNDVFEYELGDNPWVKHRPVLDSSKRGPIIGGYCVAWLNGLGTLKKITVLSIADIEKVRKGSKQWSPERVKDCPDWYVEKTCVHRNCKILPKNRRLATVIAMMEAREANERGEEFVVDELEPSRRIETPASAMIASTSDFSPSNEEPKSEAAGPSKAAQFPLPFGKTLKDTPIGQLDKKTLSDAYAWAREQPDGETVYRDFLRAAEELMEERNAAADKAEEPF